MLDRIQSELRPRGYLIGDAFTVADLTAAALLSPLLQPKQIQYPIRITWPGYMEEYRASVVRHPAAQWAAEIFRRHRGVSAEVHRPARTS